MRLPFPFRASAPPLVPAPATRPSLMASPDLNAAAQLPHPDVDIVLVHRDLPAAVAAAAARRSSVGPVFSLEERVEAGTSCDGVFAALGEGALHERIANDVALLARTWSALTGRRHLRAKLTLTDTDNCRKLHSDYVELRILCTYAGPGTWLVPEHALDRSALGVPGDPAEINRRICPDPALRVQAEVGDLVFLKGKRWREGARGAVHRSPALEGTGARRLVLTVDGAGCGC
ncbi:MAG: DUF1826 domain-containing protein [Myxococcota bacterium]